MATFLLVIIMLNLLIALVTDGYFKVYSLNRQNKNFERANLLLEIDLGMSDDEFKEKMESYLFISQCIKDEVENTDKNI